MENTTTGAASDTAAAPKDVPTPVVALMQFLGGLDNETLNIRVDVHGLSEGDLNAARDAYSDGAKDEQYRAGNGHGPFRTVEIQAVNEYDVPATVVLFGPPVDYTFGDHLTENAASFTEVQS